MIRAIAVHIFDFLKKLRMDALYKKGDVWGREKSTTDIDAAMALLPARRFARCLDLGTGMGYYAERAATISDEVTAVDISPKAIELAKKRVPNTNIRFTAGNIRDYADTPFDLVILGDSLYYLGDTKFPEEFKGVIRNISKLVAPAGNLLMANHIATGRTEDEARGYERQFAENGLKVVKSEIYAEGKKRWLLSVLERSN